MGCSASSHVDGKAPHTAPSELLNYDDAKGPFWTSDGTACVPPRYAEEGLASKEGCPARTLPEIFAMAAKKRGTKPALRVERNHSPDQPESGPLDTWTTWTWQQYYDDTRSAAKGMIALGLEKHDAVNIFGFNSPEWFMGELAAIFSGAKAAGIYPSDTAGQVTFKARHSGAAIAVVEDQKKLNCFIEHIEELPKMRALVAWGIDENELKDFSRKDGSVVRCLTWDQLLALGNDETDDELNKRLDEMQPGECCTLIYTSGTTGDPKAVMISHDNIIYESWCVININKDNLGNDATAEERILSYLPLSHVAGMMVDIVTPIITTALRPAWQEVYFARPYDLKKGTVGSRLRAVLPTMFLGVPLVWEKIALKIKAIGATVTGCKKSIGAWAKGKGLSHQNNSQLGGSGDKECCHCCADCMVLSKIKANLGLSECKFGFTGAAPISKDTLEYFGSLGIQINEVYGMSECTGATTFSTDAAHVWGSCGWEMPGVEVKCLTENPDGSYSETPAAKNMFNPTEEEQGEICFRGRHIMMGYMANPDLGQDHVDMINGKNASAIDENGWLHSGDKGCIDERGMVRITGRYKELIIGKGGENIAPVPIENEVKRICPAISNIMMIGDKRKFNVALVTLKAEGATGEQPGTDELSGDALGVTDAKTISAAVDDEKYIAHIMDAIKLTNKNVPNPPSRIGKFTILPADFSVETGELTPTLKLKRSVVEKKHINMVEQFYLAKNKKIDYLKYNDNPPSDTADASDVNVNE